jgi:hypothetical protein
MICYLRIIWGLLLRSGAVALADYEEAAVIVFLFAFAQWLEARYVRGMGDRYARYWATLASQLTLVVALAA